MDDHHHPYHHDNGVLGMTAVLNDYSVVLQNLFCKSTGLEKKQNETRDIGTFKTNNGSHSNHSGVHSLVLEVGSVMKMTQFLSFAREYNIIPGLMSSVEAMEIYNNVIRNSKNDDMNYTDFAASLVQMALIIFSGKEWDEAYPRISHKLRLLFFWMDQGSRMFKDHQDQDRNPQALQDSSYDERFPISSSLKLPHLDLLDCELEGFFESYCSFGDRLNAGKGASLSSFKFCKLLRECGLMDQTDLSSAEADVIFHQTATINLPSNPCSSMRHKLKYDGYYVALAYVGKKVFPDCSPLSACLYEVLLQYILPSMVRKGLSFKTQGVEMTFMYNQRGASAQNAINNAIWREHWHKLSELQATLHSPEVMQLFCPKKSGFLQGTNWNSPKTKKTTIQGNKSHCSKMELDPKNKKMKSSSLFVDDQEPLLENQSTITDSSSQENYISSSHEPTRDKQKKKRNHHHHHHHYEEKVPSTLPFSNGEQWNSKVVVKDHKNTKHDDFQDMQTTRLDLVSLKGNIHNKEDHRNNKKEDHRNNKKEDHQNNKKEDHQNKKDYSFCQYELNQAMEKLEKKIQNLKVERTSSRPCIVHDLQTKTSEEVSTPWKENSGIQDNPYPTEHIPKKIIFSNTTAAITNTVPSAITNTVHSANPICPFDNMKSTCLPTNMTFLSKNPLYPSLNESSNNSIHTYAEELLMPRSPLRTFPKSLHLYQEDESFQGRSVDLADLENSPISKKKSLEMSHHHHTRRKVPCPHTLSETIQQPYKEHQTIQHPAYREHHSYREQQTIHQPYKDISIPHREHHQDGREINKDNKGQEKMYKEMYRAFLPIHIEETLTTVPHTMTNAMVTVVCSPNSIEFVDLTISLPISTEISLKAHYSCNPSDYKILQQIYNVQEVFSQLPEWFITKLQGCAQHVASSKLTWKFLNQDKGALQFTELQRNGEMKVIIELECTIT